MNSLETLQLDVYNQQEEKITPVLLELFEDEEQEIYEIKLRTVDEIIIGQGNNLYDALLEVRKILESKGCHLRCAGSSLNVYPSGMSKGMGDGRMAYKLAMGKKASRADLIDIFSTVNDHIDSTIDQQQAFYSKWLASHGLAES